MKNSSINRAGAPCRPRKIQNMVAPPNSADDLFSVRMGVSTGFDAPFNAERVRADIAAMDADWARVSQIPNDASELVVLTRAKKLGAYIMAISGRTPQRFRATYIARMQNYCIDIIECILRANAVRVDGGVGLPMRAQYQGDAIIKLKMLGYISLVAQNAGCILLRQYRQIAIQLADVINLVAAWRKSDTEKWGKKTN